MYKLFIADDEPKIRKGLSKLINSLDLDIFICGEAEDGQTAINKAEVLKPDILLVDICMPIKSGLDFIGECKSKLSDAHIVIISGHDEFEYAKKALELKVDSYLLKPVSRVELETVLAKCIVELDKAKETKRLHDWALEQLNRRKEFLVECFLKDLVQGKLLDEEISEQIAFLGVTIPEKSVLMICRIGDEQTNILPEKDFQIKNYAVTNILSEHINNSLIFKDEMSNIVVIYEAGNYDLNTIDMVIKDHIVNKLQITVKIKSREAEGSLGHVYADLLDEIRTSTNTPIVDATKRYIAGNYSNENLSLTSLSTEFKVSTTYISRLLKQETGLTFVEYLTQIRMNNSIIRMQNRELTLLEVSSSVGFKSQHYFSTVFKKCFGVSPTEYRQNVL